MRKTLNKSITAIFMFTLAFAFTSCSNDDSSPVNNDESSELVDKWWYDANDYAADIYFHSDGHFEQVITMFGQSLESTGDWHWIDENTGILKIDNYQGGGQLADEAWVKINNLTEHSMTVQMSVDGESYSDELNYLDTDTE